MKKFLVLLLSLVMLTSLAVTLVGCGEEEPQEPAIEYFNYTALEDGSGYSISLTLDGKTLTEVEVPATYKKKPVVAISASGFKNAKQLETVTLPESVKKIGLSAFENCSKLTSIDLTNVETLSRKAFYKCTKLSSITFGANITEIPQDCFYECTSIVNLNIPNTVTEIGKSAFSGCSSLTNVTLGTGLEIIGDNAFEKCTSWTDLKLPTEKTLALGDKAFLYCGFTIVKVPANVVFRTVGGLSIYAFQYLAWDAELEQSGCTAIYFYDEDPDKETLGKNTVGYTWNREDFRVYVPTSAYSTYYTLCEQIKTQEGEDAWVRCVTSLGKLDTFDPATNPYNSVE